MLTRPRNNTDNKKEGDVEWKQTPLHPTYSQARRAHHYHSTRASTMDTVRAAEEGDEEGTTSVEMNIRVGKPRRLTKLQMATLILVVLTFEETPTDGHGTALPSHETAELRHGLLRYLETNMINVNFTYLPQEKQTTFSFALLDSMEPPDLQGKKTTFFQHPNMGFTKLK